MRNPLSKSELAAYRALAEAAQKLKRAQQLAKARRERRRLLFNPEAVERVLIERTRAQREGGNAHE